MPLPSFRLMRQGNGDIIAYLFFIPDRAPEFDEGYGLKHYHPQINTAKAPVGGSAQYGISPASAALIWSSASAAIGRR
jgi:hypothetical protein